MLYRCKRCGRLTRSDWNLTHASSSCTGLHCLRKAYLTLSLHIPTIFVNVFRIRSRQTAGQKESSPPTHETELHHICWYPPKKGTVQLFCSALLEKEVVPKVHATAQSKTDENQTRHSSVLRLFMTRTTTAYRRLAAIARYCTLGALCLSKEGTHLELRLKFPGSGGQKAGSPRVN